MPDEIDYARRHLRIGWWSLFAFAVFGLVLESLHAIKLRVYLDVSNETRRLMWTLAHAHGTLLGLVHVVFGVAIRAGVGPPTHQLRRLSPLLIAAGVLVPAGFFLGGVVFYGGDPGLGIVLVPIGAAALLLAVYGLATHVPAATRRK